ncbi:MAG: flagellar basal body-associated FliL family protein [Lachnospiraceae bacterium]|nr:flagellar basal body-associated FliL family protein [Lachnospiraceae bacterium]
MKKNLMSILILALLVVNIVLTAIMMFSVTGAMKSTTALVGRIAGILDLELDLGADGNELSIDDIDLYDISEAMTIPFHLDTASEGENAKQVYLRLSVSLQLDKTHEDYKKYQESLATNESLIKGEIMEVVSSYTLEEFQNDTDGVRSEILARLRRLYNSDFIYKVVFTDYTY